MTHFEGVHPKALKALDALRERSGRRWTVTSAKRPKKLNTKVGGASKSMHLSGRAFDLRVPHWARERFYEDAKAAGFKGFGWGEGQVHVDIRGRSEWWSYTGGTYIGGPKKWDHLYKAPATFIEEVRLQYLTGFPGCEPKRARIQVPFRTGGVIPRVPSRPWDQRSEAWFDHFLLGRRFPFRE